MPRTSKHNMTSTCMYCNVKVNNIKRHLAHTPCASLWYEHMASRKAQLVSSRNLLNTYVGVSIPPVSDIVQRISSRSSKRSKRSSGEVAMALPADSDGISELSVGQNPYCSVTPWRNSYTSGNQDSHHESLFHHSSEYPHEDCFSSSGADIENQNAIEFEMHDQYNDSVLVFDGVDHQVPETNEPPIDSTIIPIDQFVSSCVAPPDLISYTKIFNVMSQAKVPLYSYDMILKTICEEIRMKRIDPLVPSFSRKSFLTEIKKRFKCAEPNIVKVHLDNRWNSGLNAGVVNSEDTVEVVTFDFCEQLQDILLDKSLFGNLDNLVVNKCNNNSQLSRWDPYECNGTTIYEVLDGKWYQDYAKKLVTDATKEFCVPIGLYIDASETVVYQRYSFQPLIMFPLILTCKARNRV
jgi:hypothetical protein